MSFVRVRHASNYQGMRQRMLNVLTSNAARKINFHLDEIHVVGFEVGRVISHLLLNPRGASPLKVRTGHVSDGAGAEYDQHENRFEFPDENFGEPAEERAAIFHECVHAWRDASRAPAHNQSDTARRLLLRGSKLKDEAAAYVAEALFYLYDALSPKPPAADDSIHRESERIAASIMNRPGILIPAACAAALKSQIMAQPLYWDIAAFPSEPYDYDGI